MRIVSLSPSFTEILLELGFNEETLVGVTSHCPSELSEKIIRIGSPKAIQAQRLETLSPDLILVSENENRPEEIRELQKNYRLARFHVRSIPDVVDTVHAISDLVGRREQGEVLKQKILQQKKRNEEKLAGLPPMPTLILLWNLPYLTVNFDTYSSRLVEASGGHNVFHSDPLPEFPVDLEDMIEKNPKLLLLPSDPFPFKKHHSAGFRKYRVFSSSQIKLIDGKLFSCFGPRTVVALETLCTVILDAAGKIEK